MINGTKYDSFFRIALRYLFRILFGIVLCIVMYGTFFSFFDAEWYQRLLSVLTLALLAYMLYTGMWNVGVHDKDEVFFKRIERKPLRGFAVSAAVSIPYVIINIILMFNCLNAANDGKYAAARLIFHLVNAPFLFITLNYDYHTIGNALLAGSMLPIVIVGIGGLSYYLGLKNFSILQKSIYKDETENKEDN
ncbi:MAG TPA: hypothetical protein PK854_08230 [Oscillospiraceae bacterium]|nr:hypothetical protein [Oscillospiraceae bacterium]HPS35238.1 hypothetical protein [Oscillospiraceae bacterium]